MTATRWILALVLTLGIAGIARGQTPFHDDGYGFSLSLPKGWSVAPPEVTAAAEKFASQNVGARKFRYFGSLMKLNANQEPEGLVVFQHTALDLSKSTLDQFESQFKGMNPADLTKKIGEKAPGVVTGFGIDSISVDRARRRCLMTGNVNSADGPQKVLMAVFPSPSGFVQLNCYWKPENDARMQPEMMAIVDSLAFDPGREWVPATGGGFDTGEIVRWMVIGGVAGGTIALGKKFGRGKQTETLKLPQ